MDSVTEPCREQNTYRKSLLHHSTSSTHPSFDRFHCTGKQKILGCTNWGDTCRPGNSVSHVLSRTTKSRGFYAQSIMRRPYIGLRRMCCSKGLIGNFAGPGTLNSIRSSRNYMYEVISSSAESTSAALTNALKFQAIFLAATKSCFL